VAYSLNYHENQTNKEALVFEAASEFRNYCYSYRESLLAGIKAALFEKSNNLRSLWTDALLFLLQHFDEQFVQVLAYGQAQLEAVAHGVAVHGTTAS